MNGRERYNGQIKPCRSLAELSAIISGSVRLEILKTLADEPRGVTEIANTLDLEISNVSHNLRTLRSNGLVDVKRNWRSKVYHLAEGGKGSAKGQFIYLKIQLPTGEKQYLGC